MFLFSSAKKEIEKLSEQVKTLTEQLSAEKLRISGLEYEMDLAKTSILRKKRTKSENNGQEMDGIRIFGGKGG